MKSNKLLTSLLTLSLLSTASFAIEFDKPIAAQVLLKPQTAAASTVKEKTVYLMNIKLTPTQTQRFTAFKPFNPTLSSEVSELPSKANVGMNRTPVLDQGQHGSCVTFANTAAIDALLGKGDEVSQLCSLALGNYLESRGYYPSGWEGSLSGVVLNQMLQYGYIDTDTQKTKTCGGLSAYPVNSSDIGSPMSLDEYHALSQNLNENIYYRSIMTLYDRFAWKNEDKQSAEILKQVKKSIVNNSNSIDSKSEGRLTFAVMLPVSHCSAGACGSYHAKFDTWTLTDAIKQDSNPTLAGHEMVITGYDDTAIVRDDEGKIHKGVLKLRNSWGSNAGDKGNYYMTYDFFRQYLIEVQEIVRFSESDNT